MIVKIQSFWTKLRVDGGGTHQAGEATRIAVDTRADAIRLGATSGSRARLRLHSHAQLCAHMMRICMLNAHKLTYLHKVSYKYT